MEDVQSLAGYIKGKTQSQCHIYEKLYPWWSTSQEDVLLLSSRMWVSCMEIKRNMCPTPVSGRLKRREEEKNLGHLSGSRRASRGRRLLLRLRCHRKVRLKLTNQVGRHFWRSRSCSIWGKKKKQHSSPQMLGGFSRASEWASLITDCRRSFIYKPQGFYRKSEELISCRPILGHHHHVHGSREDGACRGFSFFKSYFLVSL